MKGPNSEKQSRAAQTDGAPGWSQQAGWTRSDYDLNYSRYRGLELSNGRIAASIAWSCRERFGTNPDLLPDIEPEEQQ